MNNDAEQNIINEVELEFSYLPSAVREAVIKSRLMILAGPSSIEPVKGDFSSNADRSDALAEIEQFKKDQ